MDETIEVLISEEEIDRRISEMATEISKDYEGKTITLLGTLKGGVIFLADLARKLDARVEFDFVRVSSYGNSDQPEGEVQLQDHTSNHEFAGKHILVVEDIVDTGHTLNFLRKYLTAQNPASLKICVLLDKPDRRENKEASFDYLGFTIPDKFVVGYGLDYAQRYRNLPYLGVLHF